MNIHGNVLTVHGDLRADYIFSDSAGRIVMDGVDVLLRGWLIPSLTITGDVELVGETYVSGDVIVDGSTSIGHLEVGDFWYVYTDGDLLVTQGSIGLAEDDTTFTAGGLYIEGDVTFDGGTSVITGGIIIVGGDFTVTAASCTAFAPSGGSLELYSDSANVSIGCSGLNGNRPFDFDIYQEGFTAERTVTLLSDVYVANEIYLDGGNGTRVIGNGHTLFVPSGSMYIVTLDQAFLHVTGTSGFTFYMDSLTFTGMTGETEPQLVYTQSIDGCASCYEYAQVFFDPTSAGPYVHAIDNVLDGDSTILYISENPGDGPARTVITGEAAVYWADVPMHLNYERGDGQTAAPSQPLADSLVVQVWDYNYNPVAGVPVTWTVTAGNGSVSPASTVTDANGEAMTQLTVGDSTSFVNSVIATSSAMPGDTVAFVATLNSSPAGVARPGSTNTTDAQPQRRPAPALERRRPSAWPERPARVESVRLTEGDLR